MQFGSFTCNFVPFKAYGDIEYKTLSIYYSHLSFCANINSHLQDKDNENGKDTIMETGRRSPKVKNRHLLDLNSEVYACLAKNKLSDPLNARRCLLPNGMPLWTLEYTVSGCEYVRSPEGKTVYLGPGDMLLVKPGSPRDHGQAPDCAEWTRFWFIFEPHEHWKAMLLDNWPEIFPGTMHIAIPGELRTKLEPRMQQAAEIYRSAWQYRDEMVMNVIEEILLWCHTVNPQTRLAGMDERIHEALHFMKRRFADSLQIEVVAQHVGLSRSRFTRLFHKQTGRTPREFIESCRIEEASYLLKLNHQPVSEIAYACGFNDPARFSNVFKARTGKRPSEMQKGKIIGNQ